MAQRELTDARLVVVVERGRWDIRSIKMFRREPGKDFVVIVHGSSRKNLPRKSKRACRDCSVLISDLEHFGWKRRVRAFDVGYPLKMWNNLFQEFYLLGEQTEPSNSCDVPARSCEAAYEAQPHGLPSANHDDRDGRRLPLQRHYKGERTGDQNVRTPRYEFAGECRKLIQAADRRYAVENEVLPLDPAKLS